MKLIFNLEVFKGWATKTLGGDTLVFKKLLILLKTIVSSLIYKGKKIFDLIKKRRNW